MYVCVYVYMYVCIYVIMYVCMYVCMYICICMYVRTYLYIMPNKTTRSTLSLYVYFLYWSVQLTRLKSVRFIHNSNHANGSLHELQKMKGNCT